MRIKMQITRIWQRAIGGVGVDGWARIGPIHDALPVRRLAREVVEGGDALHRACSADDLLTAGGRPAPWLYQAGPRGPGARLGMG
jgi:hypothetical protein